MNGWLVVYSVVVTLIGLSLGAYVLYLQDECQGLATECYRMKQAMELWRGQRSEQSAARFTSRKGA